MALRQDGYEVNMVGTRQHGTDMQDNDHEATSGAKLQEVLRNYLPRSLPYRPNIVYINIGTNNANSGEDVSNAYEIMASIVEKIWGTDGMGETCVIVSTLLATNHGQGRINRISMNQAYRNVVRDKSNDGKCIYLADMEPAGEGSNFLGLSEPVWMAGETIHIHPNDEGHKRMAYVFYAAITRALRDGMVKQAADMEQTGSGSANCDKMAGNGEFSPNTQRGSGEGNGIYQHSSAGKGVILTVESPWDRNQWRWARLFSRKYDDLLGWYDYEQDDHRFGVWKNSGDGAGKFSRIGDLRGNIYCIPRGLRFADIDGDGLDDIVCVSPSGDLHISRNMGNGDRGSSKLPTFEYLGKIMNGKAEQSKIRLADIDGDGRADYGVVHDSGAVEFWRNSGTGKTPGFWQHLGIRSTMVPDSPAKSRNEGIRFEDINGDGRDDWMWLTGYNGETTTYTNTRSCQKGRDGNGLHVAWRQAFFKGQTSGWTHGGISHIDRDEDLEGDNNVRDRIHFARIYGRQESFAFKDQSVKDYVFMEVAKGDDSEFKFKVHAFKNEGSGGTKLEADGNKYCNMHGWSDGRADYVWVRSTGEMDLYPSRGVTQVGGGSFWGVWKPGFWKPPQNIDRRELHLADWNGDGACDIIWADPKNNHRVTVWINNYPKNKNWDNAFTKLSNPPDLQCNDRNGIGLHDNAVQFAYLGNDNRRADYLCIRENGLVRGRRQLNDGSFGPMVQFKKEDGIDRANIRWGDVNGDGRDDLIWVDKFNGNARVSYGGGPHGNPSANGGSHWQWRKVNDPVYDGSYAGTCQYFPDLNGNGRADLHSIMGTWTNKAETWFNKDCALRDADGDDPGTVDLPVQPGNPIGGDGPGDGDSPGCDRESDSRDFRNFDCDDPLTGEHSNDNAVIEAWGGLDVIGAWRSALDWWHCKKSEEEMSGFSNGISDFFNGPQGFRCEVFGESGNCGGGNALQCHDVRWPAGYFILNSFRNIASINRDWNSALVGLSDYNDPDQVASDFGMSPSDTNPKLAILLDVVVMGYSMVMGPIWNKVVAQSKRPGLGGGNAGTLKDEMNDLVKNSATLAKDVYAATHKAQSDRGTQMIVARAMKEIVVSWRENTQLMTEAIFDGSDSSNLKLTMVMDNAAMLTEGALEGINQNAMATALKRTLHAQMIPITWSVSAENMYPVIIREEIGCSERPRIDWTNSNVGWMTSNAYSKRICKDGISYWLVAPQNYAHCKTTAEGDVLSCPDFDLPPGFDHLEKNKYDVNTDDVVQGSINTWSRNGRKNGGPIPEINTESVDAMIEQDLKAPGFFRIPVCDMSEVRDNWQKAYEGASTWEGFPCDK